jgi:aerobic-type carbon monoxide dehydrogenase small subunit (CoxS/CutS family)
MASKNEKTMLRMKVNGRPVEVAVKPTWTLLRVLREELRLTGTKKGCEQGDCGACVVIMNGRTVNSCLVLALQADSKEIETIEGMGRRSSSIAEKLYRTRGRSMVSAPNAHVRFCSARIEPTQEIKVGIW